MSSLRLSNLTPSKWLCFAIVLFCMFGAPELVSGTGAMTDLGARIICIYIGMAFGWLTLDLAWPSVLGILAVGLSGYASVNNVLKMCFGNSSALLVFFVFIITGVIDKAGVSRWIALHICSLPIGRGRPWVMTFCILAAIMTLTLFIGVSPGVLVVWAIFYSICEVYGIKPGEHWATMVMVAIPFFGSVTASIFPFKSLPVVALGAYSQLSGGDVIDFPQYFAWSLIVDSMIVVLALAFMRFVLRPDVSKIYNAKVYFNPEELRLTTYQKIVLLWFFLFIVMMMIPSLLPSHWELTKFFKKLGNTGCAALMCAIFFAFDFVQNESMRKTIASSVRYDALLVNFSAIGIAGVMSNDASGICQWFVDLVTPLTSGQSTVVILMLLVAMASLMSQFLNNLGSTAIYIPIAYSVAVAANINPALVCMCCIAALNIGILTPSGSNPAAMLYSNAVWAPGLRPYAYAACFLAINFAVLMLVGVPIAEFFFPSILPNSVL